MKKLFIVLAVASLGFVACNNEASTESTVEDSIAKADSIRREDSIAAANAQMQQDTSHHDTMPPKDTTKK